MFPRAQAVKIDRENKIVISDKGATVAYDQVA
jgi:NAD(P)H-nitrite reductase large subunit